MDTHPSAPAISPVYLDISRPVPERVQDLIARMTRAEKIGQLMNDAPGIPRLGLPAYNYWSEALHGVARNGRATVFPQAIGLAASWDIFLLQRIASAIGDEGRAKYHAALRRKGETGQYQGLNFWSPNINIFRDPRWGRGQETYGEDPYLTGEIGASFVRGLQGDHPRYLKAAACAKHFAVHSGPEKLRHRFNAGVSMRDLHDTYLPAFKKLVIEAKVEAVMGAYNRVNGEPCCAHSYLMGDVLGKQWEFAGHYVSDCGAVTDISRGHKFAHSAAEAAADALKSGCDLECGTTYQNLGEALELGLIEEADLDRALSHIFTTRFKLGTFDPPEQVPYASIPMSVVGCKAHRTLAYQAALESIVLLKNKEDLLPLDHRVRKIRVLGPSAAEVGVLLGNYFGLNGSLTTLLEGIVDRLPEGTGLEYRQGCQAFHPNAIEQEWLFDPASQPDVVVACMGLNPLLEGEEGDAIASTEEGDRPDIALPVVQAEFIRKLGKAGVKIVLVLTGGGPIALGDIEDCVDAILFVWYPGEAGGIALADTLFGNAVPSGKLPITFPRSVEQLPPFDDYSMAGRTYRYMTVEPQFPFGFGLSYSQFGYSGLKLSNETLAAGEPLSVKFTISNIGPVEADEVAQLYLSDLEASVPVPLNKLVCFRRVHLKPGERRKLEFTIPSETMQLINEKGEPEFEPGMFRLTVGGCSPGQRGEALGAPKPASAIFRIN
jgi:beta-glucosidase